MAQLNITLNQDEILHLLSDSRDEAFKNLLQESINAILKAESALQLGAEPYERSETRTDSRNGYRDRPLNTRVGTLVLKVPRHRDVPFKTLVFDNYKRSEAALVASMAEMVVNGVSSRKITKVMETLCDTSFSKTAVSEVCKDLDTAVREFKDRPLDHTEFPFMSVDATYLKVRENHRIVSKALMIALATSIDGRREIVGFDVYENESKSTWRVFLESLKDRGIRGLKMITSDAHEGIINAIGHVFPEVPWQRCQTHFSRNIMDYAPKKYQKAIHGDLIDMYNSHTIEEARLKKKAIMDEYFEVAEKSMDTLDRGFDDAMTIMVFPESMRRFFRTTNYIERLNMEVKRRTKVIGIFPNTQSILRLVGSLLIERNENYSTQEKIHIKTEELKVLSIYESQLRSIARSQKQLYAA